MLFDTPGLTIPTNTSLTSAQSLPSPSLASKNKRKRTSSSLPSSSSSTVSKEASVELNLDKLMKRMRKMDKDSGWGGELGAGGKSGVEQEEKDRLKSAKGAKKGKGKAGTTTTATTTTELAKVKEVGKGKEKVQGESEKAKPRRFEPAKKEKRNNLTKEKETFSPASSSNLAQSLHDPTPIAVPVELSAKPARHSAPKDIEEEVEESTAATKQTPMQLALRAKLAGGKFRMLNETLYTSTGEEAWSTMKEEGAFDDYHAGFRSQSSHWPVHPLTIFTASLSALPTSSLIVDFGCGDATLARSLVPKGLKVISFDLVSKDGWVVEAECSSVPLPGSSVPGVGGQIVDCVVCCLSLMGTDWVKMVREARRILKYGGQLKIAEVTSRFTNIDSFLYLIGSMGFTISHKDLSNTHFVMFDFVKAPEGDEPSKRKETDKKAATLLKPCIYKKR